MLDNVVKHAKCYRMKINTGKTKVIKVKCYQHEYIQGGNDKLELLYENV